MRHHPLTPMTDANLVRVLGRQTRAPVGLVELTHHRGGAARGRRAGSPSSHSSGYPVAIVDALFDRHLDVDRRSQCGTSTGHGRSGSRRCARAPELRFAARPRAHEPRLSIRAPIAMLSGSCSAATLAQVEQAAGVMPTREIDPLAIAENPDELPRLIEWACDQIAAGSVLLYSSGEPGKVQAVQQRLGHLPAAASRREGLRLARGGAGRPHGVRTFVVAGGETSAAVLQALRIRMLTFGDELDPGVPWTRAWIPTASCSRSSPAISAAEGSSPKHWSAHDDGTAGAGGARRVRALALSAGIQLRHLGQSERAAAR